MNLPRPDYDTDLVPEQLPSELPPVAEFNIALLPENIRPWVKDIAELMQCPVDYAAVSAVTTLGSVIGRKIAIRPQANTDWQEVPNQWAMLIGRPSQRKTPAQEAVLSPMKMLITKAEQSFQADQERYAKEKVLADMREEAARNHAKAEFKKNPCANIKLPEFDQPEEPIRKRYITTDPTVEALAVTLQQNPNGILVHRDELVSLLKTLERDDKAADRGFYLTGWSGKSGYTVDRIGRGHQHIPAVCISMLGATQPGRIAEYVRAAITGGKGDDGLIQRFGLMVWPDPLRTFRNVDRIPNYDAKRNANEIFERLDWLTPEDAGATRDEHTGAAYLRFTPDALEIVDDYRANLERRLRGPEIHPALESHLGKYNKLVPTLALIDHLAINEVGPVQFESAMRAIEWAKYLESHAARVYSSGIQVGVRVAKLVLRKIASGQLNTIFKARDIYRKHWAGIDGESLADALQMLVEHRWLVEISDPDYTTGRPTSLYQLNPAAEGWLAAEIKTSS